MNRSLIQQSSEDKAKTPISPPARFSSPQSERFVSVHGTKLGTRQIQSLSLGVAHGGGRMGNSLCYDLTNAGFGP